MSLQIASKNQHQYKTEKILKHVDLNFLPNLAANSILIWPIGMFGETRTIIMITKL